MKKILTSIILVLFITLIAKASDDKFIEALRNCSKFQNSDTVSISVIRS